MVYQAHRDHRAKGDQKDLVDHKELTVNKGYPDHQDQWDDEDPKEKMADPVVQDQRDHLDNPDHQDSPCTPINSDHGLVQAHTKEILTRLMVKHHRRKSKLWQY